MCSVVSGLSVVRPKVQLLLLLLQRAEQRAACSICSVRRANTPYVYRNATAVALSLVLA